MTLLFHSLCCEHVSGVVTDSGQGDEEKHLEGEKHVPNLCTCAFERGSEIWAGGLGLKTCVICRQAVCESGYFPSPPAVYPLTWQLQASS